MKYYDILEEMTIVPEKYEGLEVKEPRMVAKIKKEKLVPIYENKPGKRGRDSFKYRKRDKTKHQYRYLPDYSFKKDWKSKNDKQFIDEFCVLENIEEIIFNEIEFGKIKPRKKVKLFSGTLISISSNVYFGKIFENYCVVYNKEKNKTFSRKVMTYGGPIPIKEGSEINLKKQFYAFYGI